MSVPCPRPLAAFRVQALVVGVAAACVVFTNLGGPPLWDEDEPKNAAASVAMAAAGEWVVPRYNGALRADKPPLVNWLQITGFAVCGPGETGARIGSAVLTCATALVTARTAATLLPQCPLAGLWAGLALGTCVWSAVAGRAATPDAALACCTTLILFLVARAVARMPAGPLRLDLATAGAAGAAAGAAVLAKGPVGLVLPLAALVAFAWWQEALVNGAAAPSSIGRRVRLVAAALGPAVRGARPLVITAVALAVALPWYALVWQRTDGAWIRGFFLVHNLGRFAAPLEGHSGPPFYHVLVLAAGFFPWSIVLALAAGHAALRSRCTATGTGARLAVTWALVWIGCFSCAATKLPGYIYPAYPAVAILTAAFLEDWRLGSAPRAGRWMPAAWLILALGGMAIAAGLAAVADRIAPGQAWLAALGAVPVAGAWCAWRAGRCGERGSALGWLAGTACLVVTLLAAVAADVVGRGVGARPLVAAGDAGDAAWATYECTVPGLVFYSGAATVPRLADPGALRAHLTRHPTARVVMPASALADLHGQLPAHHDVLARSKSFSSYRELVLVGPRPATASRDLPRMPSR